jgi:ribonucleoside-diphosphate reductase alpha chain
MSLVERTPEEAAKIKELLQGRDTALPFTSNALQVVTKRYLLCDAAGNLLETPEEMFRRVANGLASVESQYDASPEEVAQFAEQFYSVMSKFEFTPAGRTLTNTGAPTPLVANCIVLHIEDTMESIFGTLSDAAMLQKAGSGLGFPLHLMRPAGTATKASLGQASGPISFLHVYNTAFGVIKQQNRHGANMGVMSVDHPDILEFIHCKDREGDLKNFNVSVGLTDRFMEAVSTRDPSSWMCEFGGERMLPREVVRDSNFAFVEAKPVDLTACELFARIVDSAWKTGEPGCVFLDTVNRHNPLPGLGRIEACNPCGECALEPLSLKRACGLSLSLSLPFLINFSNGSRWLCALMLTNLARLRLPVFHSRICFPLVCTLQVSSSSTTATCATSARSTWRSSSLRRARSTLRNCGAWWGGGRTCSTT